MTKRLNAEEVIANVLGSDITDVRENRYQYGRTSKPVFSKGDYYYCASLMSQQSFTKLIKLNALPIKKCWVAWKVHMGT